MFAEKEDFASLFLQRVGRPVQKDISLRNFSHFKIGGPADFFFEVTSQNELFAVIRFVREKGFPFYLIGGGYNILFSDEGYRGLILKNSVQGVSRIDDTKIEVYSGTSLHQMLHFCEEHSLGGLEFMAGIPGTLGGAVYGNAGAFEQDIGGRVSTARILDSQNAEIEVENAHFAFGYRDSRLKSRHDILVKASLCIEESEKIKIEAFVKDTLEKRKKNHPPWETACAGSYFKNPVLPGGNKIPAATFLDKVGAKGLRVGGAAVYASHANFIINQGTAKARDVRGLASELKRRVWEEYGIKLEEEVIYLPEFGSIP
jgi:UDP-N-acetylmuramate dehydrogenase